MFGLLLALSHGVAALFYLYELLHTKLPLRDNEDRSHHDQ